MEYDEKINIKAIEYITFMMSSKNTLLMRPYIVLLCSLLISIASQANITGMTNYQTDTEKNQSSENHISDMKIFMKQNSGTLFIISETPLQNPEIRILDFKGKVVTSKVNYSGNKNNSVILEKYDTGLYFIDIKALNVNVILPVILK